LIERTMGLFANSSIFTMKRTLGDEAMHVIAEKQAVSTQELAAWYAKWVVRLCNSYRVDFGLSLRNRPDEAFHHDWALKANSDQLVWEVLNRVHRLLNTAEFPPGRPRAPAPPGKVTSSGGSAQ
jgi:hypothetical protein